MLLLPPRMFVANVGDSRAIATDHDGEIIFESVDQRPDRPAERSRILRLGGAVRVVGGVHRAAGILAVSRAFGNAGLKHCVKAEPEVTELDLARVETCILCSDGLTDVVDAAKAVETVRGAAKETSTSTRLLSPTGKAMRAARDRRRSSSSGAAAGLDFVGEQTGGAGAGGTRGVASATPSASTSWGTKRRVANALTSLAKMRQSMDNITALAWCCSALNDTSLLDGDGATGGGGGGEGERAYDGGGGPGLGKQTRSQANRRTSVGTAGEGSRARDDVDAIHSAARPLRSQNGVGRGSLRAGTGAARVNTHTHVVAEATLPRHSAPVGTGGAFTAASRSPGSVMSSPSSSSRHERHASRLSGARHSMGATMVNAHTHASTTAAAARATGSVVARQLSPLTKNINLTGAATATVSGAGLPTVTTVTSPSSTHKAKRTKGHYL